MKMKKMQPRFSIAGGKLGSAFGSPCIFSIFIPPLGDIFFI